MRARHKTDAAQDTRGKGSAGRTAARTLKTDREKTSD